MSFLAGMIKELPTKYSGNPKSKIPLSMQCPVPVSYGPMDKYLSDAVRRICARSTQHLKRVEKYLNALDRVVIPTDRGYNNLLKAIKMQMHVPKHFTEDMMRHQLSSYFVERVEFLYPKMEGYLKSKELTYTSYVIGVYSGHVWADKFLIGAIGMMYNVWITVISPYFSDVWNAFHDGHAKADIVLVCNGVDFGSDRDNITHFTATRGKGQSWQCVGAGQVYEIGLYTGHSEGRKTAIDLFTITMNQELLFKTNTMLTNVNQLCCDVKAICIEHDQVIEKLEDMKITLGDFKCLTAYYVEDKNVEHRNVMPVKERRIEIIPSFTRSIPKIRVKDSRSTMFGKQLVDEALQIMNEDCGTREEEVSCQHEVTSSKQKKQQDHECEHSNSDGKQLTDESLQIMNEDCTTWEEVVSSQNEVSNSKRKKQKGCESELSSSDKKRLKTSKKGHPLSKGVVTQNEPDVKKEKTVETLKKRKHCKIKVGAVGKPKKSLLPSFEEYQQSMSTKQTTQEMPIVHSSKSTVSTEQVHDANSQHDEGEIRDESTHIIYGVACQDNIFNTESTTDVVHELQNQGVTEKENIQMIEKQMEQEQAVTTIMKELTSEEQVNSEPDVQIIDREDEDNGITIIDIDDVIKSRVNSQDDSDMFTKQEGDARVTELINNKLKIPGYKVVTVQPIATYDELFGDNFPVVSININPQTVGHEHTSTPADTLPTVHKTHTMKECPKNVPSIATTSNTQEPHALEQDSHMNTVQDKLTKILPTEKHMMNWKFIFHQCHLYQNQLQH